MKLITPENGDLIVRPCRLSDAGAIDHLLKELVTESNDCRYLGQSHSGWQPWPRSQLLTILRLFPNPWQHSFCTYVVEQEGQVLGAIQVSPFNSTGTTWRVHHLEVNPRVGRQQVGSRLLRHCLESIQTACTWLLEVDATARAALALYRQNGFQPLAEVTYWTIPPRQLQDLAAQPLDLPNLLPVTNADACLLCQLDTAAMPPLVRQVFDRHPDDFRIGPLTGIMQYVQGLAAPQKRLQRYLFEPQRKAAIGYFQTQFCTNGIQPHGTNLTVHPGYTQYYGLLLAQIAKLAQQFPPQHLLLASADFQSGLGEVLKELGAEEVARGLLMSRAVWHKLREPKTATLERLQLSGVLPRLQPGQDPTPSRMMGPQRPGIADASEMRLRADATNETSRSEGVRC